MVKVKGLSPNTVYRWVFCGSRSKGGTYFCAGPKGTVGSATADPPADYDTFTTAPVATLAERWNGTSWTVQSTPELTGAQAAALAGVSCAAATGCTAVGSYTDGSGVTATLAEVQAGTTWSIQATPPPAGAPFSAFSGVSCTSPAACTAVGITDNSGGIGFTLGERWDGTRWTVQTTANQTSGVPDNQGLAGVSCTSATACTAVGGWVHEGLFGGTIAEAWDGTTWTLQSAPAPSDLPSLSGVSCTSPTACTAVGSNGPGVTLAERWDGTSWTIQSTPSPPSSHLAGVSCTSATACTAVGSSTTSGTSEPLVEAWDGTSWTIQTTPPVPHAAGGAKLASVSCISATTCQAVGQRTVANGSTHTLAEAWDGTSWTIQTTPPSPGKLATLNGVSCTSANQCTAVGSN